MSHGSLSKTWRPNARTFRVAKAKESKTAKVQICADHVLWHEGHHPHSSFYCARQSANMSTKRSCGICFVQCVRRGEICGSTTYGYFTRTMYLLTALSIWQFLDENNIVILEQPPYSSELIWLCYFFLSPKLKGIIKGFSWCGKPLRELWPWSCRESWENASRNAHLCACAVVKDGKVC